VSLRKISGRAPTPCFYCDLNPVYAFGTRKVSNSGEREQSVASSPKANSEAVIGRLGALTTPSMAAPATGQTLTLATTKAGNWPRVAHQPEIQHFPLAGTAPLFPPPTNATNQPLDWTTYKLLIHNGAIS
jgi:hypothetical protein